MLLTDLDLRTGYSSSHNNLVDEFYRPCLSAACTYDRAVGYFRSTLYILVGVAVSSFALRGGRIRLVCSPNLSPEDVEALKSGYEARDALSTCLHRDLTSMLENPQLRPVAEFLATLVAANILDIRFAFRAEASGIFHDKLGLFTDLQENTVSFVGSANETFSAWHSESNHESFEVFESWAGSFHSERVTRHRSAFAELWSGRAPGLTVATFPDAFRDHLIRIAVPTGIDDAAERVRHLVRSVSHAVAVSDSPTSSARLTGPRALMAHQLAAVANWHAAGDRGIVAHVTGAGKTLTALRIVREWIATGKVALILVPSELLLHQWLDEIGRELADLRPGILKAGAGSGAVSWEPAIPDYTRAMPALGPRIVLSTMATAATDRFLSLVKQGSHLLVVADECHRIGSAGQRRILDLNAGGQLGLSATPQRFGDPVGTAHIFRYFGTILDPPFGIADAISAGRLVPYDYFVTRVPLSDREQNAWDALTERIRRDFLNLPQDDGGARISTDSFKLLLFRRASILKRAHSKVEAAVNLITSAYAGDDRWLVYCDDQTQLQRVVAALTARGLPVFEYHSNMHGERHETLEYFTLRGGILVAIKCLDEGVDIPSVNKAIILASSRNSREFIQRRGRVLRVADHKFSAQIFDLIVTPAAIRQPGDLRESILRTELTRASLFAETARNRATLVDLQSIARDHGISDFDQLTDELEED